MSKWGQWAFQQCKSFFIAIFSPEGPPATHHQAGPVQPDTGCGRYGPVQVPGVWGPRTLCHLEEERGQSAWKGLAVLPAGAWQSSDSKYQGGWPALLRTPLWLSGLIVLHKSITAFNLLTSVVRRKLKILAQWEIKHCHRTKTSSSIFISDLDGNHTHQMTHKDNTKSLASLWDALRGFLSTFWQFGAVFIGRQFKWYGRSARVV